MRPTCRRGVGPARAASCSKASSHCPGKARGDVSQEFLSPARPRESGDPGPQIGCRGPGSRFARPGHEVVDSRLRGNERSPWQALAICSAQHCGANAQSHGYFTTARRSSSRATATTQTESRRVGTRRLSVLGQAVARMELRWPVVKCGCAIRFVRRHGRAWPGHPRLALGHIKTWMPAP